MLSCGESGGVREGTTASKEPIVEKRISIWGIVLCVGGRDVGTSVFDAFIFPIDIFFRKPHRPLSVFGGGDDEPGAGEGAGEGVGADAGARGSSSLSEMLSQSD